MLALMAAPMGMRRGAAQHAVAVAAGEVPVVSLVELDGDGHWTGNDRSPEAPAWVAGEWPPVPGDST